MPAACSEQNALQNISCTVIELFSLQYHTHVEHVSFKSISSSYDIFKFGWNNNIEAIHLLILETFYRMKTIDFTRLA